MQNFQIRNGLYVVISSVVDREEGFRNYRFTAKCAAEELGFEVIRNPEDAGMEQRSFEDFLKNKCPIVIMIVGSEDSDVVRRECRIALDNCLPLMVFIEKKDNTINANSTRIITEISKLTYEKDCTCFKNCEDLYDSVKNRLVSYISKKVSAFPTMEAYVGPAYSYSVGMFEHAKKRVVLYQKTSSLLLGPKMGNSTEIDFNQNLYRWIENMDPDMEFLHIYSGIQTQKAMKQAKYNIDTSYKKLKNVLSKPNISKNPKFVIRQLDKVVNTSFFICDCEAMYIFSLGKEQYTITIPPYIMRNNEIEKILTELKRSGTNMDSQRLLSLYSKIK